MNYKLSVLFFVVAFIVSGCFTSPYCPRCLQEVREVNATTEEVEITTPLNSKPQPTSEVEKPSYDTNDPEVAFWERVAIKNIDILAYIIVVIFATWVLKKTKKESKLLSGICRMIYDSCSSKKRWVLSLLCKLFSRNKNK